MANYDTRPFPLLDTTSLHDARAQEIPIELGRIARNGRGYTLDVGPTKSLEKVSHDGSLRCYRPDSAVTESTLELHNQYCLARAEFIRLMNWLDCVDDYDRDPIDSIDSTIYVIASDEANPLKFLAGKRLTPVTSILDSHSFAMLGDNPRMQQAAADNIQASELWRPYGTTLEGERRLFDITRMVPDLRTVSQNPAAASIAMQKIIGGALSATDARPDDGWLFLVHKPFLEFLNGQKIKVDILVSGLISEKDHTESFLLATRPLSSFEALDSASEKQRYAGYRDALAL